MWLYNYPLIVGKVALQNDMSTSLLSVVSLTRSDIRAVKKILRLDPTKLNKADSSGNTPLHKACDYGHSDVVQLLLSRGADVHRKNGRQETPLHCASLVGGESCVRILVSSGSDINARNREGYTPLHLAVDCRHYEVTGILVRAGADLNAVTEEGETVLHIAAKSRYTRMVRMLLSLDEICISLPGAFGKTALHWACRHGDMVSISALLDKGADMSIRDCTGRSPIFDALELDSEDTLKYLVERGADLNVRLDDGRSLFFHVLYPSPKPSAMILLTRMGCNMTIGEEITLKEQEVRSGYGKECPQYQDALRYYYSMKGARNSLSFVKCTASFETLQPTIPLPPELLLHVYKYCSEGYLSMRQLDRLCKMALLGEKDGKVCGGVLHYVVEGEGGMS